MIEQSVEAVQQALEQLQKDRQSILQQIQREQAKTAEIARSAWRAQEEERGRLARELHDGLGQSLTALKNDLTRLLNQPEGDDWRNRVAAAVALCSECLEDTRFISRMLRPALLDDLGLDSALRQLCRTVEREGLETELLGLDCVSRLSPDLGTLVFRLVQEAANNAVKHAEANTLVVRFIDEGKHLVLVIMDDGRGFDSSDPSLRESGFGLQAMGERVRLFGGSINIESSPGEGTRIRAAIPTGENDQESSQ